MSTAIRTSVQVVDIVERCVAAFNRDDFDALIAQLDEELRFRPVLVGGELLEGIDRFIEELVKLRVDYDDVLVEELEVDAIADDYAIATTTVRAIDDDEIAFRRLAHTVRIENGRVAECLAYSLP